jgi:hypothetical protein
LLVAFRKATVNSDSVPEWTKAPEVVSRTSCMPFEQGRTDLQAVKDGKRAIDEMVHAKKGNGTHCKKPLRSSIPPWIRSGDSMP